MVIVRLYLHFREVVGKDELRIGGNPTPMDVLAVLSNKFPGFARYIERGDFIVLLNGVPVPDKDLRRITLNDNDVLEILPIVSGGSKICY